jgi:hypothetical protein
LRDGRACVASLKKLNWASNDYHALARRWAINCGYALYYERRFRRRIHRIRYEDLLREPRVELKRLHHFLGVEFEDGQLQPRDESAIVPRGAISWHENVSRQLIPERASAWKKDFHEDELDLLNALIGKRLHDLGYEDIIVRRPTNHLRALIARCVDRLVEQPFVLETVLRIHRQRLIWMYHRNGVVPE